MKKLKEAFLFLVGLVTMSYDEFNKAYHEAEKSVEKQRKNMSKRISKSEVKA